MQLKEIRMDYATYERELNEEFRKGRTGAFEDVMDIIREVKKAESDMFDLFDCNAYEDRWLRKVIVAINRIIRPDTDIGKNKDE